MFGAPPHLPRIPPLADLADLVAPHVCGGCGCPGTSWCAECEAELRGRPVALRLRADVPIPVFAAGRYGGAARRAINAFKEADRVDLAAPLSRALAHLVWDLVVAGEVPDPVGPGAPESPLVLVPVPASARAVRRRGFDHVLRLALGAAEVLAGQAQPRCVVVMQLLEVGGKVRDAAGLSAAERAANLAGRMRFVRGPTFVPAWAGSVSPGSGATFLLVDDVVTTGATLAAALGALRTGGVAVRSCLALRAA